MRSRGCYSKLASLFANYLDESPKRKLPPPCSRVFSENYLHSFNGSLISWKPFPILLPALSSFLVFDVLSEVSSDSWRKRAEGECRGKSTAKYQRGKKEKNERETEKQGVTGERQSGRSKKKRTSLSGRLFLQVGRERASRPRLVERDVCL